jgi:hypothetical protein
MGSGHSSELPEGFIENDAERALKERVRPREGILGRRIKWLFALSLID